MSIQTTKLKNGLRIVTDHVPSVGSIALGVWVGVGTRNENMAHNGVAHMVEHMLFKGTKTRNSKDIVEQIENVGGSIRFGPCRSITIQPAVGANPVKAEMLVETSDRYWAKAWPLAAGKKSDFVEGEDRKGPFTVAAAVDGTVPGDRGKESPALRAVVVGSAAAFANQNISPLEVDFMVNAIQWVLGRNESLGISPKTPKDFSVSMDEGQQRVIMLSTLLGIPALTGLLGFFVWWRRRS